MATRTGRDPLTGKRPRAAGWKAQSSLWLGIASVLGAGFLLLPPALAIVFGYMAMAECSRNPNATGRKLAVAGVVMGYICLIGWVIVAILIATQSATPLPENP